MSTTFFHCGIFQLKANAQKQGKQKGFIKILFSFLLPLLFPALITASLSSLSRSPFGSPCCAGHSLRSSATFVQAGYDIVNPKTLKAF
jgi:hypothetical protein